MTSVFIEVVLTGLNSSAWGLKLIGCLENWGVKAYAFRLRFLFDKLCGRGSSLFNILKAGAFVSISPGFWSGYYFFWYWGF